MTQLYPLQYTHRLPNPIMHKRNSWYLHTSKDYAHARWRHMPHVTGSGISVNMPAMRLRSCVTTVGSCNTKTAGLLQCQLGSGSAHYYRRTALLCSASACLHANQNHVQYALTEVLEPECSGYSFSFAQRRGHNSLRKSCGRSRKCEGKCPK